MIREISIEQLKICHGILEITYGAAYSNHPNRGRSIAYEDLLAEYKSGHMFFLYEIENKFVGTIRLMQRNDFYIIKDIAVLPEYQNRGYGKELIEFAKDKVKELGAKKVELGFFDDNEPLRRWYEKHGFKSVKTFAFNGSSEPDFLIRIMESNV